MAKYSALNMAIKLVIPIFSLAVKLERNHPIAIIAITGTESRHQISLIYILLN